MPGIPQQSRNQLEAGSTHRGDPDGFCPRLTAGQSVPEASVTLKSHYLSLLLIADLDPSLLSQSSLNYLCCEWGKGFQGMLDSLSLDFRMKGSEPVRWFSGQ